MSARAAWRWPNVPIAAPQKWLSWPSVTVIQAAGSMIGPQVIATAGSRIPAGTRPASARCIAN